MEGADCPHCPSRPSRNSLAEVGWLNFRNITNRILSLGENVQPMISVRNEENSKLLRWRRYKMSLGQMMEVWHWAFSVAWSSDPISCSGFPCFLFAVSCEVVVPGGCQGSLQACTGRVGCRKPGRGTQAGLSKPAFNILIIVTRPMLFFH